MRVDSVNYDSWSAMNVFTSCCLLSYFLLAAKEDRHKLLRWMGSDMIDHNKVPMPTLDELPKIWLRLAKIPALYKILADKGFAG